MGAAVGWFGGAGGPVPVVSRGREIEYYERYKKAMCFRYSSSFL